MLVALASYVHPTDEYCIAWCSSSISQRKLERLSQQCYVDHTWMHCLPAFGAMPVEPRCVIRLCCYFGIVQGMTLLPWPVGTWHCTLTWLFTIVSELGTATIAHAAATPIGIIASDMVCHHRITISAGCIMSRWGHHTSLLPRHKHHNLTS